MNYKNFITLLILIRVGGYFVETDIIGSSNSLTSPFIFIWIERIIASFLTYDLFKSFKNKGISYFKTLSFFIDLVSILPFWIGFFLPIEYLGIIRSLRILSLFKLFKDCVFFSIIWKYLKQDKQEFKAIISLTGTAWLLMSVIGYESEKLVQPDKFDSLSSSAWWAFITMTTIGYGDMFPVTAVGKSIGIIGIILSLISFASLLTLVGRAVSDAVTEHKGLVRGMFMEKDL